MVKAVSPVGTSRSDLAIFAELGKRLGVEIGTVTELFTQVAAVAPGYAGIEYATLGTVGAITAPQFAPALQPAAATAPATESGKFALLTGSALHHCGTLSLHGEGPLAVSPTVYVEISRADAEALKVAEGDTVTVTSVTGSIKVPTKVTPRIPEGTAFAPYHFAENSVNTVTSGSPITWVTISK